jgi:hypothetical protein
MAGVVAILPNIPKVFKLAVCVGIGVNNTSISLTLRILDFGFWILDFLGYKPHPWWVEKSTIVNLKSPSPAPKEWSGSI